MVIRLNKSCIYLECLALPFCTQEKDKDLHFVQDHLVPTKSYCTQVLVAQQKSFQKSSVPSNATGLGGRIPQVSQSLEIHQVGSGELLSQDLFKIMVWKYPQVWSIETSVVLFFTVSWADGRLIGVMWFFILSNRWGFLKGDTSPA